MVDELLKVGQEFKDDFTTSYDFESEKGISEEKENEYLKWISKVGTYIEINYKKACPEITKNILKIVEKKSVCTSDYNIIIGCLETIKELYK